MTQGPPKYSKDDNEFTPRSQNLLITVRAEIENLDSTVPPNRAVVGKNVYL